MARYIDADFVTASINRVLEAKKTEKESTAYFAFEQFKFLLVQAPTADVVEVKHGEWKKHSPDVDAMKEFHKLGIGKGMSEKSIFWTCSCCGGWGNLSNNYCPNCGAKMDGKALKEREKE